MIISMIIITALVFETVTVLHRPLTKPKLTDLAPFLCNPHCARS